MGSTMSKQTPQASPATETLDQPASNTQSSMPPTTTLPITVTQSSIQARARAIAEGHPNAKPWSILLDIATAEVQHPEKVSFMLDNLEKTKEWAILQEKCEIGIAVHLELQNKIIRCLEGIKTRLEQHHDLKRNQDSLPEQWTAEVQFKMRKLLIEVEVLKKEEISFNREAARVSEAVEDLKAKMGRLNQEMDEMEQKLKEMFDLE